MARTARTDYRMQRRAVLREVLAGTRAADDVRDAHPDLLRAGTHIGTEVREACPLCDHDTLRQVDYVFEARGRQRAPGGRAVPREALARQAQRCGDITVYTVEVCLDCHWHHLVESYVLLARAPAITTSRTGMPREL